MLKTAWPLLMSAALAGAPAGPEIAAKMAQSYSGLNAFLIEATQDETIRMGQAGENTQTARMLAMRGSEKLRAASKSDEADLLLVTNGERTWRAVPGKKLWAVEDVAAASWDEGDGGEEGPPRDLVGASKVLLAGRYIGLGQMAGKVEYVKEETLKVDGKKTPCWVIRYMAGGFRNEVWVNQENHLAMQHKLSGTLMRDGRGMHVEQTVKVKRYVLGEGVEDALFSFAAPENWKKLDYIEFPAELRPIAKGERAAAFTLSNLEGEKVALASLRGKVVALDFWATWCPPCRAEMPHLDKVAKELEPEGFVMLTVGYEEEKKLRSFMEKNKYSLPVLVDRKNEVMKRYGIRAFPTLYLVDREGIVQEYLVGGLSEGALRTAIRKLLAR